MNGDGETIANRDGATALNDDGATGDWKSRVREELEETRRRTLALVERLPEERLRRQVRSFLSPMVWDLGHIANFEDLWLVRAAAGDPGTRPDRDGLYDPFDVPRQRRSGIDLPDLAETLEYLDGVRARTLEVLDDVDPDSAEPLLRDGYVYRMVIQHEGQHQETMLQALDVPEDDWGLPADEGGGSLPGDGDGKTTSSDRPAGPAGARRVDDTERIRIPAGPFRMGTRDRSRAYDNERPEHEVEVDGFRIDRYPVTVRRWLEFMDDGGYRRPELWSPVGREWLERTGCRAPQGWEAGAGGDGALRTRRLGRSSPLRLDEPVQHVCFWEAEAFARWAGGRLPTEAEWEKAAAWDPDEGRRRAFPWGDEAPAPGRSGLGGPAAARPGPRPVGSAPEEASAWGVEQLLGDVYEWTSSPFAGYPGFETFPYREYSEVFFGDTHRVLRGASWASHEAYARNSYRNWDLPQRRQIFAGVRLAWDPD